MFNPGVWTRLTFSEPKGTFMKAKLSEVDFLANCH